MNGTRPTMPQITGRTALVAHLGFPTESFKAPMIYNPWFAARGIDAVVVPMGVRAEDYPAFLPLVFRLSNICGALVTMPHKVTTVGLVDHVTPTAAIAGAANAVLAAWLDSKDALPGTDGRYVVSQGREVGFDARLQLHVDEAGDVWSGGQVRTAVSGSIDW